MGSNAPMKTPKRDVYGERVPWCTRSDISPLRYPGGKRKLAPFIADLITRAGLEVELLVEPFAGGAAVAISLLESGHVQSIALADADPLVAAFWKTVFHRNLVVTAFCHSHLSQGFICHISNELGCACGRRDPPVGGTFGF
jgi:hypothetical protein